ncbi:MAG TPA: tRNA pseudouridine(38-40) synthase TruA [Acidimicrobiia bacterium]|nr:tRNA pseudouridine(38-40) synthase TruA [Acidimicrobiia bacterium]
MTLFESAEDPPRCRLVLAYDGTNFRGFANQRDVRTVAGVLGRALERVMRHPVPLTCAGRTDAGVHAWGQVVSFDADPGLDPWQLQGSLNGMLAPEIIVRDAEIVDASFDARRSASWRSYRYTIVNRPQPDPFLARYAWWVPDPLDRSRLRLASDPFAGEHDFAAFCRKGPAGSTTIRRVLESRWCELGDGVWRYEIRAQAFCWQMVRSIVGTLVDAGRGRRAPGEMLAILRTRDRGAAAPIAPPHGLCLWSVGYDTDRADETPA